MKFGTTIALCAATAIGTAYALNKLTGGEVKDAAVDMMIDHGLLDDDFDDENFDDFEDDKVYDTEKDIFVVHNSDNKPFTVMMPVKDATNLYEMLEDAVGRLSESASDLEAFGDKAISFERLYDTLEKSGIVEKSESVEETAEPIGDDPSVCGHSEENCDAEDPSKLDPDSGNYEITSKESF